MTDIGSNAFSGCSGLTSVTISEGVTSIGHDAFSGCSSLTSITIPLSVTSIGAFAKCKSLKTVKFTGSAVPSIAKNAFKGSNVKNVNLLFG